MRGRFVEDKVSFSEGLGFRVGLGFGVYGAVNF